MLNKVTSDVRVAALQYGPQAIETLAKIMLTGESDKAKVAAAKEILDRAYGKSPQAIDATINGKMTLQMPSIKLSTGHVLDVVTGRITSPSDE